MRRRGATAGRPGRRWRNSVLAGVCALALAGCVAGPDETASDGAPATTQDDPAGTDAPDPSAEPPADGDGTPDATPDVPPLHPAIDDLPEAVVTLVDGDTSIEVAVKVAADDPSRRRGLMEVEDLPDGVGMLFVFAAEREGGFWMWNTRIPLDIAFVGTDGTVHTVATMVPCEDEDPADCPTTAPDAPYVTALEVPAGWFDRVGLGPGATLTWSEPVPPRP